MSLFAVWVPGMPKTKGSMVAQERRGRGGGVRLTQSVDGSERWAGLVAGAVRGRRGDQGLAGPVAVRLAFWLPTHDVTKAHAGDVDKLARNVLDALTVARAYGDDVQVVQLEVMKYPALATGHPAGLLLRFWPMTTLATHEQAERADAMFVMRIQGLTS